MLTPWSLLTTLIYTNTKYFNLKTIESHMTISFANFGKYSQWACVSSNTSQAQQINYLRFYAHNPGKAFINLTKKDFVRFFFNRSENISKFTNSI